MQTITINGTEYNLRCSLRGLFLYEKIMGKPYAASTDGESALNWYMLFYACLLAGNEHFALEVPAFIDACDEDPRLLIAFNEVMEARSRRTAALMTGEDAAKKKTKQERP